MTDVLPFLFPNGCGVGGIRTVQAALEAYGYKSDPTIDMLYTKVGSG